MADPHVVSALKAKRAEIAGHIQTLEKKASAWRARLAHIDETIRIFSPPTDPEAIPPKRTYRRSRYFRPGELARWCLNRLREANGKPITTADLVTAVLSEKKLADTPSLRRAIGNKVAACLRHECKRGAITKTGTSRDAAWSVPQARSWRPEPI